MPESTSICLAALLTLAAAVMLEAQGPPEAKLKRVELTRPGTYDESNCLYVMTADVTAKGNGFEFTGKDCVIDLGGHTLTFNTEKHRPTFKSTDSRATRKMLTPPWGIHLRRGAANIELRNGTIVQGKGRDKNARCVFVRAHNAEIHHTTTVTADGDRGRNFYSLYGPTKLNLHHNYIVNRAEAESGWYGAISLSSAGNDCNIHHNTIVGGHQGILISGGRGKKINAHVHHNYIQHRRTRGAKVPQAIYIRANGCEIDHNEIVSIDGRGLEPTGDDNHWHDNIVDVRYTSKADGGYYPENRCYGYWARNPNGNRIINNLFVVNNEVMGDASSNSIGIELVTDESRKAPLRNCTVVGNRLFINHRSKRCPAWGAKLAHVGDQVVFKNNFIWARTAAATISDQANGATFEGNTLVRADAAWKPWAVLGSSTGKGVAATIFKDNKIIDPPIDDKPPAAPTGLKITPRINGYELHWAPNPEADALGYHVYRDDKRVDDRLKCGRFHVDTTVEPKAKCRYAVSAVDASGNEGPKCPPVSPPPAR